MPACVERVARRRHEHRHARAGSAHCSGKSQPAFVGAVVLGHAAVHVSQAPVAGAKQVVGHCAADLVVVEADLREAGAARAAPRRVVIPDFDHGCAGSRGICQQFLRTRRMAPPGHHHGGRVPAQQGAQLVFFTLQRIAGAGDQELEARRLQPVAQALRGFCKDRIRQVRQQRRHDVARAAGQQARQLVGHVAGVRKRGLDARCRVARHHRRLAQEARHGDRRDAGRSGHVLQRDAAVAAPGLAWKGCRRSQRCTGLVRMDCVGRADYVSGNTGLHHACGAPEFPA